jgi:hypothetical protein
MSAILVVSRPQCEALTFEASNAERLGEARTWH